MGGQSLHFYNFIGDFMYDLTQLGENTYCFNCFSNVGIYKLNEKMFAL